MKTSDRLVTRESGGALRGRTPGWRLIVGLAVVIASIGAAAVLWPAPGTQLAGGPVASASASEAAAFAGPTTVPHDVSAHNLFWDMAGVLGGEADGPRYRSLADIGARSEAIVLGSFTGQVEPGREPCDEESLANGAPREQACVFFANVTFAIDEILGGALPVDHRRSVKLEYMLGQRRDLVLLPAAMPTGERAVIFIGSKYLRRAGIQDIYYAVGVGKGTFPEVAGRVWTVNVREDPEFGRLDGMLFGRFIDLVRGVPVLDLMPEG